MKSHQMFLTFFTILTLVSVMLAFSSTGAPWKAREEKIDDQHIQNMNRIASDLYLEFTQSTEPLPESVATKNYYVNPQTSAPDKYNYRKISDLSFELCADFMTDTTNRPPYVQYVGNTNVDFRHKEGYQCFMFNFMYPENLKTVPLSQPIDRQ